MNLIYQSLDKFASKGKISEEAVAKIKESGITTYTSIAEAVKDAQFIVEAAPKRMDIKNSTLAQISAACSPDAVISTNSSTMSITELSKAVEKPERFVGVHYFFPAVLMKLVEVIRGDAPPMKRLRLQKRMPGMPARPSLLRRRTVRVSSQTALSRRLSSTTDAWPTVTALRLPILTCP